MFCNAETAVWAALVVATLLSWWLGTNHGLNDADAASTLILAIAFLKARFVGAYFMDLRRAPPGLRRLFDGWCVVMCTALAGMFLAF